MNIYATFCYKSIHLPGPAQRTMDQLSVIHQLTAVKAQTGEFNDTDHPDTEQ